MAAKSPKYPQRLSRSQEAYQYSVRIRFKIFWPFVVLLARLGVSANLVSYAAPITMIPFIFLARDHPWIALACVVTSVMLDMNDGLVARYTGKASDKGKFVDMVCDNVAFTMFLIGLAYQQLISSVPAVLLSYTMILSKVLRSITHAYYLDTDWFFKAVAGFLPNFAVGCMYVFFLLFAASGINCFTELGYALGIMLAADSLLFFHRIQRDLPTP